MYTWNGPVYVLKHVFIAFITQLVPIAVYCTRCCQASCKSPVQAPTQSRILTFSKVAVSCALCMVLMGLFRSTPVLLLAKLWGPGSNMSDLGRGLGCDRCCCLPNLTQPTPIHTIPALIPSPPPAKPNDGQYCWHTWLFKLQHQWQSCTDQPNKYPGSGNVRLKGKHHMCLKLIFQLQSSRLW